MELAQAVALVVLVGPLVALVVAQWSELKEAEASVKSLQVQGSVMLSRNRELNLELVKVRSELSRTQLELEILKDLPLKKSDSRLAQEYSLARLKESGWDLPQARHRYSTADSQEQ